MSPEPTRPTRTRRSFKVRYAMGTGGALALAAGTALAAAGATTAAAAPAGSMALQSVSSHYIFTTLGDPADPTFNQLLGINDFGVIAGYFGSGTPAAKHPNKGYTVSPYVHAMFTNENYPASQQTQVTAINDWGNTVGFYVQPSGATYGFLDESGVLSKVSDPLTSSNPPVDQLLGVNNNGKAVGFYNDAKGNSHAFQWDRFTKAFTAINPPGATSATATGINDHGTVAGFFTEANGDTAGFIEHGGSWKVIEVPGSHNTQIFGLNETGKVVGMYVDSHKQTHGFVYSSGVYKTLDDPNGVGSTVVNGLNNAGQIVGFYTDAKGNTDGFIGYDKLAGFPSA